MQRILLILLKIAVSGGLLYLALSKIDLGNLWSRLNANSIGWLVLAACIIVFQIFLAAVRWREITARCDAPLTLGQATRFNLVGTFFNQVLPSSIGGDAVRIWLVKNTGAGWRNATYSVFVDRAIGLIALALLIAGSLPWSYSLIADVQGRIALTAVDLIALVGGLGFLVLGQLKWPFLKRWWLTHHPYQCSIIAGQTLFNARSGPKVALLSLSIHALTAAVGWCVVQSIKAPIAPYQIFLLIPPVVIVTMLPIAIAGWGVRETAMMVAFGYADLPSQDGINISLLFGAVTFAVGLLGGLVWILSPEKSAQTAGRTPLLDA